MTACDVPFPIFEDTLDFIRCEHPVTVTNYAYVWMGQDLVGKSDVLVTVCLDCDEITTPEEEQQ